MKSKQAIFTALLLSVLHTATVAQPATTAPKLIVQIVVSQMRYDYLERFRDNFSEKGFRFLVDSGTNFTNARYNYMGTNTVAGLATLTTGTEPAGHGIIAPSWYNYTTSDSVNLIADAEARGLECEAGQNGYSPINLVASTLGDRLHESDSLAKVIAVAWDPYSAIVCGGSTGQAFWVDPVLGDWVSSSYYFSSFPDWVRQYNATNYSDALLERDWTPERAYAVYKNRDTTLLSFAEQPSKTKLFFRNIFSIFKKKDRTAQENENTEGFEPLFYTPYGNTLITDFAKEVILKEKLGEDGRTDLLTICYDTPRLICEYFGPRSVELEDMYYKLDWELGDLLGMLQARYKPEEFIVVLSSDHGSSNVYKENSRTPGGRFNTGQFKMILNGFLSAQYEPANWILGYSERQIYLNREMIYKYGFDLEEVQSRAATFALQFRGVSGALTASDMQSGYFGKGYGEKMQNSFYPKRSGDVTINLMPGWIEERPNTVSLSGSLFTYDTHVPLIFMGGGIPSGKVERNVNPTAVVPTLARILQIPLPDAATGEVLDEVVGPTAQ